MSDHYLILFYLISLTALTVSPSAGFDDYFEDVWMILYGPERWSLVGKSEADAFFLGADMTNNFSETEMKGTVSDYRQW